MLRIIVIVIGAMYSNCQDQVNDQVDYGNIQEVVANLSRIYQNPTIATHRQLLETGILYLDKLMHLEYDVKRGVPKAERKIRSLHKEGAYEQLENVPFSSLTDYYGWNSMEVAEFENIIHRAKEMWRYFLDEIEYGSFDKETTTIFVPPEYLNLSSYENY